MIKSPLFKKEGAFPEIKKANRGKFTRWAKGIGMSACAAANAVMAKKEEDSIKGKKITKNVREMANYAKNFGCSNK